MRSNIFNAILGKSGIAATVLLLASGVAFAQQQINLTAGSATATLPDGTAVPMWGYSCGAVVVAPPSTATCRALKSGPLAAGAWSPVVITVPTGQTLQINLTNSLPASVPTSLTIVGQLGGGLGTPGGATASPAHAPQDLTWPVQGASGDPQNRPVPQGPRVRSFSQEVAAGATTSLTWTTPRAGTYLLESGSHPSIQGSMGLYGIVVVTDAVTGTAYPGVTYGADIPLLFSEIDPVQNAAVAKAVTLPGFSETTVWSGQPGGCGNPATPNSGNCYPPAVNYQPLYYLVNGVAFDKSNAGASLFPTTASGVTGNVLVRMVNAGLRMHVPSIVGAQTGAAVSGVGLIAEDGNPLPGVTRVQSEVFMAAGKTYDVMVNTPASGGVSAITGTGALTGCVSPQFSFSGGGGTGAGATATVDSGGLISGITVIPGTGYTSAPLVTITDATSPTCTSSTAATAVVTPGIGTLPIFDRGLGLSANATVRDAGMLAYLGINGGTLAAASGLGAAQANADTYNSVITGKTLVVSDPSKGVMANDVNISGVQVVAGSVIGGTLTLNTNGTFTFVASAGTGSFQYCGNGATAGAACATVTLGAADMEGASGITAANDAYTSTVATSLSIKSPGVLVNDTDGAGYPLTAELVGMSGVTVTLNADGSFNATVPAHGVTVAPTFTYRARNSQGTLSATATVTLTFPAGSNLAVSVVDGIDKTTPINDYRWIIEEDRTFYVDPKCTLNPPPAGCATVTPAGAPAVFGTNFHTSYMPVVAQGCVGPAGTAISCEAGQMMLDTRPACTGGPGVPAGCSVTSGQHVPAVCDIGDGSCRPGLIKTPVLPSDVVLDPTKHYYISVLPGDAMDPGHAMSGAPIPPGATAVTVLALPQQPKPAKLSVFVFEDDQPLNGEHDGGGGFNVSDDVEAPGLAPNEPGLGGFNITLIDLVGGTGDSAGQLTYDEFGQPLANALAGTVDPLTHQDACPISKDSRVGVYTGDPPTPADGTVSSTGITGVIPVCPKYEGDGLTESPLAGQAVIVNMPPGRYGVIATPAADRIARGEEWLQTNTLDGGKDHEAFIKANEPAYFQEFGPAGFHVSIGFANPKWINEWATTVHQVRDANGVTHDVALCSLATPCKTTVKGKVTGVHMSRTPDQRLYGTGTRDTFGYTQCYVSLGSPDGADFSFTKCDPTDGSFTLTGIPSQAGDWRVTVFDQWNDQIVDGISTPIRVSALNPDGTPNCTGSNAAGYTCDMKEVSVHAWKNNLSTRTFFDANGNGVSDADELGLALVPTNIRFRDGSISNLNSTDLEGFAGFNEVFPIFNWYVLETDSTRYKNTGTHVVNDAGGPVDNSAACAAGSGYPPCGSSSLLANLARTREDVPLPLDLRVPGAVYCGPSDADCLVNNLVTNPSGGGPGGSTGRVDPAWVTSYGWQSFAGQNQYLEFGKAPFAEGENGGIRGHVVYASTRPFDDPTLLLQLTWEPMVPHVTINLYQVGTAPDGSQSLTMVDTTQTSSWDDWAQGHYPNSDKPYMNCPGQSTTDPFYYTIFNQPNYLDWYNSQHGGPTMTPLPDHSQFKCYDGMHAWNQLEPAPYDGMYKFPSIVGRNPATGVPVTPAGVVTGVNGTPGTRPGSNCTICVAGPDGNPMLPVGKYVVEMVLPPGYELVKEEDKNILLGDTYEAPVTQQFAGFGNVFIMPDQAAVAATYNANNPRIMTTDLGAQPRHEGDTGSVEVFWPCVGAMRTVPDYMSLYPQSGQNAPFAGATRPLCDRKLVTLEDQMSVLAKFYVFSSTHVAGHFTGVITDDFTSEFDPFAPAFGEKFSPAYLPVSVKDWAGNEISRVSSDAHGIYNGLNYSTFSVNPPDPSGYIPQMMVMCMNDRGGGTAADPLYQSAYSQFCYELPFMPGQTGYFDTPVIPTAAFAAEYNHPDCAYPDATPAVASVTGDVPGPWLGGTASVTSVALDAGGAYSTVPAVNISNTSPGGSGLAGTALMGLNNINCTNCAPGGTSNRYTNGAPTVTFGAPNAAYCAATPSACIQATAQANITGSNFANNRRVGSITITNRGSGYISMPSITVTCTGTCAQVGTRKLSVSPGALPLRMVAFSIAPIGSPAVGSGGSGYVTPPTVNFTSGGCVGSACMALATAVLGDPVATGTLTINALGAQDVNNYGYSGPNNTTDPFNLKTITRHYVFGGSQGTGSVTIGGVTANVTSWSDSQIQVTVPAGVPRCSVQQQAQFGGSGNTLCGELVITAGNGKKSVDAVTVTIGGQAPTMLAAGQSIQSAIDAAKPGDLLIVPPGSYHELLLMWKPVRLQGVGAASSILDANAHPSGILDNWRLRVVCLFGLAPDGTHDTWDPGCGPALFGANSGFNATANNPQVDRLPLEATVGWDVGLNGNVAEQLQEPTLMGAYEGAGITVLAKGVRFPSNPFVDDIFPDGTVLLSNSPGNDGGRGCNNRGANPFPSSFQCNPSRIDGLSITNSSQGGGGIFVHGWAHNLEIANNRVHNNQGTLAGGISIGQGEHPEAYIQGDVATTVPGSCLTSNTAGTQLPYCFDRFVNVHHNAVTLNSSEGDELFSATPSGAGGVAFCTGADNYKFNYNWVCGNLSTGDGAGVAQLGFVYHDANDANRGIQHNAILFNQATNPTTPSNGGGLLVMSAPDTDPLCPGPPDADCNHAFGSVGDGIGPNLLINANLIMGNAAEAGAGGGIRFQGVNGAEVSAFPITPSRWYSVNVTNNIITDNVAGWDAGGVSLQDALVVNLINNTIVSNDSTASSGTLFGAFFAPQASAPTPCPRDAKGANIPCVPLSTPQPAGLSSATHTAEFTASLPLLITCPQGHGTTNTTGIINGDCRRASKPILYNDVFWQNRAFNIVVTQPAAGSGAQQATVALVPSLNQATTGSCVPPTGVTPNYWDIGLRGDTGPTNHSSGFTFTPQASVLTSLALPAYLGDNNANYKANTASFTPGVVSQYCNGAKRPPEAGSNGWYDVPPGTNEGNVPVPKFNLTAGATVDEGNNWINISWGPLSLVNPKTNVTLGDYSLAAGSPAIDYVGSSTSAATYALAPPNDFFEHARKANCAVDAGAVEFGNVGSPGTELEFAL